MSLQIVPSPAPSQLLKLNQALYVPLKRGTSVFCMDIPEAIDMH